MEDLVILVLDLHLKLRSVYIRVIHITFFLNAKVPCWILVRNGLRIPKLLLNFLSDHSKLVRTFFGKL